MQEKQINVEVKSDKDGLLTIHHLEGKLLDPVPEPKRVNYKFAGNIMAVSTFLAFRLPIIEVQQAVVVVNHNDLTIELNTNPNFPDSDQVIGKIEITDELKSFRINNTSSLWNKDNLLSFLKVNRQYFPDKEAHGELVSSLKNFQMKVALEVRNQKDTRGGVNMGVTKEITQDPDQQLPFNTIIEIPVFKGEDPKKIAMDICFTSSEAQVFFWFESDEVNEIMYAESERRLHDEKQKISDMGVLVLDK